MATIKPASFAAIVVVALLFIGCGGSRESAEEAIPAPEGDIPSSEPATHMAPATASATVAPIGDGKINGTATFTATEGGVEVVVTLQGAGHEHGIHLHENGDCGDNGKAAGAHWNPAGAKHGMVSNPPSHMGDLGNIVDGSLNLHIHGATVGDGSVNDVVGKSIVVHAKVDDLKTDPSGNSGDRVACGVIMLTPAPPAEEGSPAGHQ